MNKKGITLGEPRASTMDSRRLFTTQAYKEYDENEHGSLQPPESHSEDRAMKDYHGYPLWMSEFTTVDDVLLNGHIDDYTVVRIIDAGKTAAYLHERWPVEFDQKKNIKSLRMPLGFAAKMWVKSLSRIRRRRGFVAIVTSACLLTQQWRRR